MPYTATARLLARCGIIYFLVMMPGSWAGAQTTPNLTLNVPIPGTTPTPNWGNLMNANFRIIDTWSATVCPKSACAMTGPLIAPTITATSYVAAGYFTQTGTPLTADIACAPGTFWIAPVLGTTNAWRLCNNGALSNLATNGGIVAKVDLTAQTANIAATTAFAIPAGMAGSYHVSCYETVTTAGGSGASLPGCLISFTDEDTGTASETTGLSIGIAGASDLAGLTGIVPIHAAQSSNIQYSTTGYVAGPGNLAYALHIVVEYLGP